MSRELLIGIVIGMIIGWVIEWLIDRTYWRNQFNQKIAAISGKDNLQKIKGIGPEIEKRLNKAGIFTFKQLATLDQKKVENLIGNAKNLSDEDDLISEAKKRAKKKEKKLHKKGKE